MQSQRHILYAISFVALAVSFLTGGFYLRSCARRIAVTYERNENLWQAAGNGDAEAVRRLLAEGANPNYSADGTFTIVMMAWHSKDRETIDVVLKAQPELETPLLYAARANDAELASFLLAHGADKNTRDYNGESVLSIAKKYGHKQVSAVLEKAGAKVIGPSRVRNQRP